MLRLERAERRAYLLVLLGFVALVGLLRVDLGRPLFDEDTLFYRLPPSVPAPSLSLRVGRWGEEPVLLLVTENFRFAHAFRPPRPGVPLIGHAHLYLDGRKHASLYEPVASLHHLPAGEHTLTVSLNVLLDHRTIMVEGLPLSQDLRLRLPAGEVLPEPVP
jgi:hypothetical protein